MNQISLSSVFIRSYSRLKVCKKIDEYGGFG